MSKIFIEESTLTSIGDAIREKTGKSELISPLDMPTEIEGIKSGSGEEYFTDEELTFTGDCTGLFSYDKWKSILEKEKGRIKVNNPSNLSYFMTNCTGTDYSFLTINGDGKTICKATYLFSDMPNIEKFPVIKNVVINSNQCMNLVANLPNFTNVNELIKIFDNISFNNSNFQNVGFFAYCYSLRNVDVVMPYISKALTNYKAGASYNSCFVGMYSLDEINNVPIMFGTKNSNGFSNCFNSLSRIKNLTFETNNGTPHVVQWKAQVIDMSYASGAGIIPTSSTQYLTNYKSGITMDKEVKDDATYAALKDNPDWWTSIQDYSRYNHDSAVNTINSLPDTSAYLTTAGGTNTIKFRGASGAKTDGGAINTLTDEEIAVAAAKGWTVSLV